MLRKLVWASLIIVAAGSISETKAASYRPQHVMNAIQVCIERPENDGIQNIEPVTITINQAQLLLTGGEAGCLFIPKDTLSVSLTFQYPYTPKNPPVWTTPWVHFPTRGGEDVDFELCPTDQDKNDAQWSKTGWHEMWMLKRVSTGTDQFCSEYREPVP